MSKAKMADAKSLGAIEGADLRLWSFKKASMAKGDRQDHINFTISPGDTLKIFMDQSRFKVCVCNLGTCIPLPFSWFSVQPATHFTAVLNVL